MTLLDGRGKFFDGAVIALYCPKCQTKRNHRVFLDADGIDERLVCTSCRRVRDLPEEYRMKELRQPMLYKDLDVQT